MAVADNRQRRMPSPDDRVPPRGQALDYPESVLLIDPIEPEFKGEASYLRKAFSYKYACILTQQCKEMNSWNVS